MYAGTKFFTHICVNSLLFIKGYILILKYCKHKTLKHSMLLIMSAKSYWWALQFNSKRVRYEQKAKILPTLTIELVKIHKAFFCILTSIRTRHSLSRKEELCYKYCNHNAEVECLYHHHLYAKQTVFYLKSIPSFCTLDLITYIVPT